MWSERTHFATTASMLLTLITRLTNTQLVIPETAESTKIATQALVFYFSDGTTYGYTDYAYGWNGNCNKLYSPAPGKATVDYVEYLPESSAVPGVFSKNVDDPDIGRTEDLELRKVIIYRDPHCTEEVVEKVQKEENEDGKEVSESIEVLEPIELDVQDKIQENEKASEGEQDDVHHDSTHVFLNDQGLNLDAPASFRLILGRKMKLPTLIDQIPIEGASEEGSSINENLVNNETQGQPNSPEIASEETSNAPTEETLTEEEGEIITGSTSSDGILIEAQATEESNTSINTPDQDRDSKDTSSDGSSSNNHSDENNSMSGINEESHNDDEGQISGGGGPEQPASEDQQPRGNEDTGKSSTREKEDEASAEKKSHEEIEKINKTVVEEQHDEEFKEEIHEKPQSEEAQNNEREQIEKHKETENSASTPSQTEQPEGVENNQTKESAPQEPLQEIPTENQESPPSTEEQQSKSPFEESGHEETDHETTADSPHPEVTPPPKEEPSVAVVTVTVHVGEESTPEPTSVEESPTTTTENTVSPTVEETAVETTPNVPGLTFTPDSEYCDPKQPDSSCYVECDVEDPYCCHPTDKDFPDCCDPDDEECWRHQFILDKPDEVTPATTESQPNQTTEPPPQAQETPAKEPEGTPDESTPEPEKQEVAPQPAKRDQIPTGPSAEDFGREDSNSSLTFKQLAKSRLLRFLR
ncbi:hypothetical protein TWF788_002258 [Orbilia oligospora]|uniref:Uncharacterized protein n=2 Tax=Orbilia oligospora TaxID=2813651 RepID=A0A7C8U461_ORBOL|nr:hypothetical protein TWF788_002258 [Orbilia oligospora]